MAGNSDDDVMVTVCAECLRASCWQGANFCEAWRTASTKRMRIGDLRDLALENPDFWAIVPQPGAGR